MTELVKGKKLYGTVVVGTRGQIVIPAQAREQFGIQAGDRLVAIGVEGKGIMLMDAQILKEFAQKILQNV